MGVSLSQSANSCMMVFFVRCKRLVLCVSMRLRERRVARLHEGV